MFAKWMRAAEQSQRGLADDNEQICMEAAAQAILEREGNGEAQINDWGSLFSRGYIVVGPRFS